jgi:predicted ABC-type ATPase
VDWYGTCLLAIYKRVASRVEKGGHMVPVDDIKRRFSLSLTNFWNLYRKLSGSWYLFYNSDDSFEEVARNVDKEKFVLDEQLFSNFNTMVKNYE